MTDINDLLKLLAYKLQVLSLLLARRHELEINNCQCCCLCKD